MSHAVERIWARDGLGVRALAPLSWLFGAVTAVRNLSYDIGLLRSHVLALPSISVGNLTVGGTGKTPVSAWIAQRLLARGVRPAIVLRGYGADEPLVHARLTPGAVVIVDADRVRGAARARQAGAAVVVLDDAFQHRRARRDVDIVLVAAEPRAPSRLLPAGPARESTRALRRAHAVVVTRKSADVARAESVLRVHAQAAPGIGEAIVSLAPDALELAAGASSESRRGLGVLRGARVLAISAIGAPDAFESQLTALGAQVTGADFDDHHAFTAADVTALTTRALDADLVVCTLKDAVKLEPLWPRGGVPLWYLSQAVTVERGAPALDALLERLVAAARS